MHFLFLLVWQRFIFLGWIFIFLWCTLIFSFLLWIFIFSNALSFFLTWLNIFSLMKWLLIFLFLIFPNLIEFLLLINLHFFSHPSQLEWIFYGISCLMCLLNRSLFLSTWWKFLHSHLFLFFFLFVGAFSSLMTFSSFFFPHSLMLSQNLISFWWIFFSPCLITFFDELSFLNLMNSSCFFFFFFNLSHCLHWGPCHVVLTPWGQSFLNMRFKHAYLIFPPNI